MSKKTHGCILRPLTLFLCLLLMISCTLCSCFLFRSYEVLEKDEIAKKLDEYGDRDLGYQYVSTYLRDYGIGNIDYTKLNSVEDMLNKTYYKQLPDAHIMATDIAQLFIERYYDAVDTENITEVTDAVLKCYIELLDDRYAYYRTAEEYASYLESLEGTSTFVGIGVMVDRSTLKVLMVYKDSPADQAGMMTGDIITAVDGMTVAEYGTDAVSDMIRGEIGTEVTVTVERDGEILELVAVRDVLSEKSVTYQMKENNIGYIYITQFLGTTAEQFAEAVDYCIENGAEALIFDVRHNPGGLLDSVIAVVDYLIPDESDRMIVSYTRSGTRYTEMTKDGHSVDLPMIVICNENTASAGELFTAAIRDFSAMGIIDAVTVGEVTYGKGVMQSSYTMNDSSGITFTIGYYNPPCDINFDGIGITPDISVGLGDSGDGQLERALEEAVRLINEINTAEGALPDAA